LALFNVFRTRDRNDHVPWAFGLNVAAFDVIPVLHGVQSPLPFFRWMSYTDPLGAATEATATMNVVPTLPDVGVTWIRTLMMPVIDEWMVQWYG
jgi:hypothetical protein